MFEDITVTDLLDRPISVDDLVVSYNHIYKVLSVGKGRNGNGYVKMILFDKSKTTRSVSRYSKELCLVDKVAAIKWMMLRNES